MTIKLKIYTTVIWHRAIWLFLYFIICLVANGKEVIETTDSVVTVLEEVEVSASGKTPLSKGGSMQFNTADIVTSVRVLGEFDAVNYIKHLSGVTTSGDYGSGLMIDGAEPSQTLFSLNNVPVFFPYRFGGIFSTFNNSHFSSVDFERGLHKANMKNRLGARINFETSRNIDTLARGTVNVGMLSSSLSVKVPIKDKVQLTASGRISYIDEIYGPFFRGDRGLSYRFWDLNFNALWKINDKNSLNLDFFTNTDRLIYDDRNYSMKNSLKWENDLLAISWNKKGKKLEMTNRAYYSGFSNKFLFEMPNLSMESPSSVSMAGVSGDFNQWLKDYVYNLIYGYEINLYKAPLQQVELQGFNNQESLNHEIFYPVETRLYADLRIPLKSDIKLNAGLSTSFYRNKKASYNNFSLDPRFSLNVPAGPGSINLHLGRYSQYLHQVGFSQIGLASDFWIVASKQTPTQHSYNIELDYSGNFNFLNFSITGYWKWITSQPEYIGQVLNLLDEDYDMYNYIFNYNGYNLGFHLVSQLSFQKFTSNIGLGYGIARRYDKQLKSYIRGNTEPGFSMNIDADYRLNTHWRFGAQFRYSTGRPYTPIVAVYMIGGNAIKDFGEPNSALFPPYNQLDLSATWQTSTKLRNHELTHYINLSVLNVYGRKNVEMMTYLYNEKTGELKLRKVYSLYRFLPSVSYTLQF